MISFDMHSASVGIIGGADGPTAIFVAGGSFYVLLCLAAGVVVGLAAGLVWRYFKKRKEKDSK